MDTTDTTLHPDRVLDLGEKGCSHLLEDIANEMTHLTSGQLLLVIANDPAAPLDIRVWSRTTGNPLVRSDLTTNHFWLQKK